MTVNAEGLEVREAKDLKYGVILPRVLRRAEHVVDLLKNALLWCLVFSWRSFNGGGIRGGTIDRRQSIGITST